MLLNQEARAADVPEYEASLRCGKYLFARDNVIVRTFFLEESRYTDKIIECKEADLEHKGNFTLWENEAEEVALR